MEISLVKCAIKDRQAGAILRVPHSKEAACGARAASRGSVGLYGGEKKELIGSKMHQAGLSQIRETVGTPTIGCPKEPLHMLHWMPVSQKASIVKREQTQYNLSNMALAPFHCPPICHNTRGEKDPGAYVHVGLPFRLLSL